MGRKIVYWVTTGIVAALCVFDGFAYLSGRAVPIFAHVGYPQQLRVILGIAKPLGAIALLVPGFVKLKEWAYAVSRSRGSAHFSHITWRRMEQMLLCRLYFCSF